MYQLGDVSIHAYTEIDTEGVDLERLQAAWNRLVERHDMLRAVVLPTGEQQVLETVPPYEFRVQDLRSCAPEAAARELEAIREEMSHQVLAVDSWPAFDIRATRLDDRRTRLHLSIDLLNCDAGSLMILNAEWVRLYGEPELRMKPLELAYRDYVLAAKALEETESYKQSWEYWRQRVPLLPHAPELPASNIAAGATTTRFTHRVARLDPERWQRLKSRASRQGLTSSSVLLTAYAEILAAWSRNPALTVNVTLFNRLPLHPEVNDIVGDFTSMILLGTQNPAGEPFQGRARDIQKQLWSDLEHRFVSGVQVLRELARVHGQGTGALMPVVFTSLLNLGAQGFRPPLASLRGLGEVAFSLTQTPQVLLDHQVLEEEGALVLTWDAVDGAFPAGLLDEMFAAYQKLLGSLADEEASWQQPRQSHVPSGQLEQRAAVNATDTAVPEVTLRDLFEARAAEQPDLPALIASMRTLTYGELLRRSHALGRRLREGGARPGTLVAVVMQKGWEQIVAVLGIHAAGAAYVPIDPALPMERRRLLLADADAQLVVTQPWLERELEWPDGVQRICVEADEGADADDTPLDAPLVPGDLSHVIYTSGSTGRPKGVMIEHRSVVNRILDVNRRQAVRPTDRLLALTSLNHDLSVYDIFGLLSAGGALVMPDADHTKDPAHWAARMASEGVTIWNSVPAYLEMLVEFLERRDPEVSVPDALRWVILSGDWIPVTLPDRLRALVPGVEVIASGGPTETTIWDIWNPLREVDPRWTSIPYGKPMANARYDVLNEALDPCPVWAPGELCIAGAGLARGYWRDDERTAERFVIHPKTGERIYRSGDQGRWLPDGNIEFLGRIDGQVKVGGYRIELGEIESALRQHPAVRALTLQAVGEARSHKRLVAYVVPTQEYASATGSPELALMEEYRQYENEGIVLLDPLARLQFKKKQPGLRDEDGRPAVPLARPALDEALLRAYVERRSYREYVAEAIPLADLGQLLSGLSFIELEGLPKYRYGSAGGLYPVQTYLYVKPGRVDGLAGGTYYYDPREHRLVFLSADAEIRARVHAPNNRTIFERSAFSIFLVAQQSAIQPMYGKWARDFCVLEAGYMSQLLMMLSPESHIGLCPIGDMEFDSVRGLFALDETHLFVHSLLGGGIRPDQIGNWAPEQQAFAQDSAQRSEEGQRKPDLAAELAAFLKGRLPEQMVPATFVFLEALPLSANGKVDVGALPEPDEASSRQTSVFVAPSTEVEQALSAIVRDVLHVDQVSVESNFFDLGGNSVHMVQILTRLRDAFGREVAITEIFRHPTIHALAGYLGQGPSEAPSLARSDERADKRRARMSARQARRGAAPRAGGTGDEP
jgi:epothilone synthetase B